jgi:hypothetical protein
MASPPLAPSRELVLPVSSSDEDSPSPRRRAGGSGSMDGGKSVASTRSGTSTGSGGDPPRPRRGRRMSIGGPAALQHPGTLSGAHSAHTPSTTTDQTDYGYGESARPTLQRALSNELDYGSMAPIPTALPRRRGRRMSVGGPSMSLSQSDLDYNFAADSADQAYDTKFGGSSNHKEEQPQEATKSHRQREKRVMGISDIKNADYNLDNIVSSAPRPLGGVPRPVNTMVTPMTIPSIEKPKSRRRASMLGAVGGAVGAVGGAVGEVVGTVGAAAGAAVGVKTLNHNLDGDDDKKGTGRSKLFKNRKNVSSTRDLDEEEQHKAAAVNTKSADRFRHGSMMERFG